MIRWNGLYWIVTQRRKAKRPRPPKPRHWYKASEVASALNVTADTVRQWANRGLLRCERTPTGRMRFARADVEAWLTSKRATV